MQTRQRDRRSAAGARAPGSSQRRGASGDRTTVAGAPGARYRAHGSAASAGSVGPRGAMSTVDPLAYVEVAVALAADDAQRLDAIGQGLARVHLDLYREAVAALAGEDDPDMRALLVSKLEARLDLVTLAQDAFTEHSLGVLGRRGGAGPSVVGVRPAVSVQRASSSPRVCRPPPTRRSGPLPGSREAPSRTSARWLKHIRVREGQALSSPSGERRALPHAMPGARGGRLARRRARARQARRIPSAPWWCRRGGCLTVVSAAYPCGVPAAA